MRNLKTSDITNSVAFPVKGGTLFHVQKAYQEALSETVKGLTGSGYNSTVMYILNGLVNTGTYPTYNISAGSVFFNGEVYLVDAATFTLTGANQAVCKIVTSFFTDPTADPVQFTDGINRNVHEIRKVVLSQDLGGSGISNYADGQRIVSNLPQLNLTGSGIASISGVYPNVNVNVPTQNKILKIGKIQIGDLNTTPTDPNCALLSGSTGSLSAYLYTFPAALADANYRPHLVLGNDGHNDWGGFNNNYMCVVQTGSFSATQMYFAVGTTASSNVQSIDIGFTLISTV